MADRVRDAQFDDLSRQQAQRPVPVARRGRPETQRDHVRLLLPVEQLRHRRGRPLTTLQRERKALQHAAPAHILDRPRAAAEGLRDLPVGPVRSVGIDLTQDPCPARLLAAALQLADRFIADLALLVREPNDVLLLHQPFS